MGTSHWYGTIPKSTLRHQKGRWAWGGCECIRQLWPPVARESGVRTDCSERNNQSAEVRVALVVGPKTKGESLVPRNLTHDPNELRGSR
jgi:hypothetical protein